MCFVAGGTGGHINAALAIGEFFQKEGRDVFYITGQRKLDYKIFSPVKETVLHIPARPLLAKNIFYQLWSVLLNTWCFYKCFFYFLYDRPQGVLGCGGYVCGPTLLAAFILRIPIAILEQNAVLGFTNKVLSYIAPKIFVNYDLVHLQASQKVIKVGNPIRSRLINYKRTAKKGEKINILIFGGSLGARDFNQIVIDLVNWDGGLELSLRHQVGLKQNFIIEKKKHEYEQYEYLVEIEKDYDWADFIICRAGASSLSELQLVKKPCVLIPYPHAAGNHQYYNARSFCEEISVPTLLLQEINEVGIEKIKEFIKEHREDIFKIHPEENWEIAKPQRLIYEEITRP